jgi:hypothetical protein
LNQVAGLWFKQQCLLHFLVFIVGKQFQQIFGKDWSLYKYHTYIIRQ